MSFFTVSSSGLLAQVHQGPLRVVIHTLSGLVEECVKDFRPEIVGSDSTLFEYVGSACACLFTNMTTQLSVRTCPEDWKVTKFDPRKGVLEVHQISGPNLTFESDDVKKLVVSSSPTIDRRTQGQILNSIRREFDMWDRTLLMIDLELQSAEN